MTNPRQTAVTDARPERNARTLSTDDLFHVLQNARRRAVLRYLLDRPDEDQFTMRTIAEAVAAWEHDTTVGQLSSTERQRVYIALYQSHLPKLDDFGVIEYDQNRGTIRPTPLMAVFAGYVEPGLHGATDTLSVPDATTSERSGLTSAVTALLKG